MWQLKIPRTVKSSFDAVVDATAATGTVTADELSNTKTLLKKVALGINRPFIKAKARGHSSATTDSFGCVDTIVKGQA